MALLLGVDTGGTYTDAVLIENDAVVATAKSLTTRRDLALGIGRAVRCVLQSSGARAADVSLASLSTTLATNALVEGQGGKVALIYIGFAQGDLAKHGVAEALGDDPHIILSGGHSYAGQEKSALDMSALEVFLETKCEGVSGVAVAGLFATRNPAHEQAAARLVAQKNGLPVTCSHELSAKLNGPKRAVTAVLNARLIGMIDTLISRAEGTLLDLGISAPLMVVRGDGALMSAAQARTRPIETILSGPAASVVGASWLTGARTALVSDIGGTTTDVALVQYGRPKIDPLGAQVGGFRTMVEAVAMRTTGLGGDSQVHAQTEGLAGGVSLGPRRVLPVALVAEEAAEVVHNALDAQLTSSVPGEYDASFLRRASDQKPAGLSAREANIWDRIGSELRPMGEVLRSRLEQNALHKLWERGLVQVAGVTPSDASHVLGMNATWDISAADKALQLLARKRTGNGNRLAPSSAALAQIIVEQLHQQTTIALLEAAFAEDAAAFPVSPADLARHILTRHALDGHRGVMRLDAGLNVDVVGLGASAAAYYPPLAQKLNCAVTLPEHGGVANAIGAVVGQISERRIGLVTCPSEGRYRVHLEDGPRDFAASADALAALEHALTQACCAGAEAAGAADVTVRTHHDIRKAEVEGREVFVEAEITVEAQGRPRFAD